MVHANIDVALDWALRHEHRDAALGIAGDLVLYVKSRGAYAAGKAWCTTALRDFDGPRTRLFGRAVLTRGVIEFHMQDSPTGEQWLAPACDVARATNDTWCLAFAHGVRLRVPAVHAAG